MGIGQWLLQAGKEGGDMTKGSKGALTGDGDVLSLNRREGNNITDTAKFIEGIPKVNEFYHM